MKKKAKKDAIDKLVNANGVDEIKQVINLKGSPTEREARNARILQDFSMKAASDMLEALKRNAKLADLEISAEGATCAAAIANVSLCHVASTVAQSLDESETSYVTGSDFIEMCAQGMRLFHEGSKE